MPFIFFQQLKILKYEEVESTNATAMQRLRSGEAKNGDIIVAGYQMAGKGQTKNSWFSSKGNNLLVSIICKDIQLKVSQLPLLNMLVSQAVHSAVNNYFPKDTAIKWPNDIMVNEQKIAGILVETTLQGEYIKNAVIGVGLNVNEDSFPENLTQACSFFSITNWYYNLESILNELIEQLDIQLSKLKLSNLDEIKEQYEAVLFGMGTKRYFRQNEKRFEGIVKGVNNEGQLLVEVESEIKMYNNKEITFELN